MAQIEDENGRGANIELNLIPFIDLMSVCITFLLITAVWAQVSMIQIGSSIYGKQREGDKLPDLQPRENIVLRVDIVDRGYIVNFGQESFLIPRKEGLLDNPSLLNELNRIKDLKPDKNDATITMQDELPYDDLISGMDQILAAGFPEVSVATVGAP